MAKIKNTEDKSKKVTVEYTLDGDTKGTYRYGALNAEGQPISETKERMDIGSNVIYLMKSAYPKAPKKVTVTLSIEE